MPRQRRRRANGRQARRTATRVSSTVAPVPHASAVTAPGMPQRQAPSTTSSDWRSEPAMLTREAAAKASHPLSEQPCTLFSTPSATVAALMRKSPARCGAAKARSASQGAKKKSATPYRIALAAATSVDSAKIRPARSGSICFNSAMCFVTVWPRPRPARLPTVAAVLFTMPYSPKPVRPSMRASRNEQATVMTRAPTAATPPQNAPRASRRRVGDATSGRMRSRTNGSC